MSKRQTLAALGVLLWLALIGAFVKWRSSPPPPPDIYVPGAGVSASGTGPVPQNSVHP